MAEDKNEKKEVKTNAEKSASSSAAKIADAAKKINKVSEKISTVAQHKKTKEKLDDIHDQVKNIGKNPKPSYDPNAHEHNDIISKAEKEIKDSKKHNVKFEEVSASGSKSEAAPKEKQKIDKKKIERIKRELMADEPSLEERNKALQAEQGNTKEEIGYRDRNGNLIGRSERIARKNEQLMEDVYRYSRQRIKDIVDIRRQIITIVITVVLVLLLIAVIALGVFLYIRHTTAYEDQYIRVSVSMTNKEIFYDTEVTGELIPKDVSPGDRFALNIVASNSNSIAGDTDIDDWLTIYVRFKITLIVNGVEYEDYIYFEPDTEVWERYNADVEAGYTNSATDPTPVVKEDDGYYYCRKVLWPNEKVTLINWLRFSETKITEVIGGNDAILKVDIEALEAIPSIVKNREIWSNAPQNWVEYITTAFPDTGEHEEDQQTDINIWWIIVFACVAVILVLAIIIVSTRRKKKKKFEFTNLTQRR